MTMPGGGGSTNLGTTTGRVRITYETSQVAKATADVRGFAGSLGVVSQQAAGTGNAVDRATGAIARFNAAIAGFNRNRNTAVNAAITINPTTVTINQRAFDAAMRGAGVPAVTVRVPIIIDPASVQVNNAAVQAAASRQIGSLNSTASGGGSGGSSAAGGAALLGLLGKIGIAGGVAAAGVGSVATVLTKGFSRLNDIDQATVKLSAMGLKLEEIKAISKASLAAVEGTAFGLNESFNTAADAINAGIKPGEQLNKYLSATANTAALAQQGMQDLGSAFSRAAIAGKLTGDVTELLVNRQVPLFKLLGEEYGVTAKQAQEMASNGEVSFDRFINAMSKTGGAAKAMGNTISGSMSNLGASISRLGASILAPLFGKKDADDATVIATAIQFVTDKISGLGKTIGSHAEGVISFFYVLGKAGLVAAKVITTAAVFISDAVVKITEVVGDLVGWLSTAFGGIAKFFHFDEMAKDAEDFAQRMHKLGSGLRQDRDKNVGSLNRSMDEAWSALDHWRDGAVAAVRENRNVTDSLGNIVGPAISVSAALAGLGLKSEAANTALKGTNQQFKEFLKQVKDKGGTAALLDVLTKIRTEYTNGGRQVEAYANAVDNLGDTSKDAATRASDLLKALTDLNKLPGGDALSEYNEKFDTMTSAMSNLIDMAELTGNSLATVDGTLDLNTKNARTLLKQIEDQRQEMAKLIISGEAGPDEAYARTVQGLNDLLQRQAGISPDIAQKIIDKYLPKDAILDSIKSQNPQEALGKLFKDDPARLDTELNLLTTTDDLLKNIIGPDGKLHLPTVLDTPALGPDGKPLPPPTPAPIVGSDGRVDTRGGRLPPVPGGDMQAYVNGQNAQNRTPAGQIGTPLGNFGFAAKVDPANPLAAITAQATATTNAVNHLSDVLKLNDAQKKAFQDPAAITGAFGNDPGIANTLAPLVKNASEQGKNFAEAFAEGIDSNDQAVKDALLRLAQLAPDYLGNSPAKYGPLSGHGWTLYRGKAFSAAYGEGIASQAGSVQDAVNSVAGKAAEGLSAGGKFGGGGGLGGGAMTLNDQVAQSLKDLQELSDFGKHLLDFGKQIVDIGLGAAKFANDLSGGRLFPKSYVTDTSKTPSGSTIPGWNPTSSPVAGLNGRAIGQGGNAYSGPAPGKNAGKQEIADYIYNKAINEGYSDTQAKQILTQAFGESGLDPKISGGQQSGDEVIGIFQEKTAFSGGLSVADRQDPTKNVDAYFRQMALAGGPSAFTDPASFLGQTVSGGGPFHPENQAKGHLTQAQRGVAPYLAGLGQGGAGGPSGTPRLGYPSPAVGVKGKNEANMPTIDGRVITKGKDGLYYFQDDLTKYETQDQRAAQTTQPAPNATGGGGLGFPNIASVLKGASANYSPNSLQAAGVPALYSYDKDGNAVVPQWLTDIVKQYGGPSLTVGTTPHGSPNSGLHGGASGVGYAVDINGNDKELDRLATTIASNPELRQNVVQLIRGTLGGQEVGIAGGQLVDNGLTPYFDKNGTNQYPSHGPGGNSHVHLAVGGGTPGSVPAGLVPGQLPGQPATPVTLTGQANDALQGIWGNTGALPGLPAKIGDILGPDMVSQIQGGLDKDSAVGVLQRIDSGIADQNKLNTPESKQIAQSLGDYKSSLQNQFGLKEGPNAVDQVSTIANGVSSIASDVFGLFDQSLKTIAADQDIANTLVRGIANTKDVMRIIDDVQETITLFQKGFQTASDIAGFAGQFTGGMDMGITSGVGGALGMISQVFAAVNTAIDIGQEAYSIITKYVGRFIQSWTGLSGASDVRYLLDEVTGQVSAYSSDNPQNKTAFNTIGRELGGQYSERAGVNNTFTIYQGPGQDPRDTMDDAMFSIRQSGQGALGYAV